MIYLAIPYTGNEEESYEIANRVAGVLMGRGEIVFSPISHTHAIAEVSDLPTEWQFWEKQDEFFLRCSTELMVVCLDRWDHSRGVTAEIDLAESEGVKVSYLDVQQIDDKALYITNRGTVDFEPIVIDL